MPNRMMAQRKLKSRCLSHKVNRRLKIWHQIQRDTCQENTANKKIAVKMRHTFQVHNSYMTTCRRFESMNQVYS